MLKTQVVEEHSIRNFALWNPAFDADGISERRNRGKTRHRPWYDSELNDEPIENRMLFACVAILMEPVTKNAVLAVSSI